MKWHLSGAGAKLEVILHNSPLESSNYSSSFFFPEAKHIIFAFLATHPRTQVQASILIYRCQPFRKHLDLKLATNQAQRIIFKTQINCMLVIMVTQVSMYVNQSLKGD